MELKEYKKNFLESMGEVCSCNDCTKKHRFNENVVNYRNVLIALIEIFERKKVIDFQLQKEKNEEFLQNQEGICKMGKKANELNIQFAEELNNFKTNLEKNYLLYMEQFFKLKKTLEEEIKYSFSGEQFDVIKGTNNPVEYNDNHFS